MTSCTNISHSEQKSFLHCGHLYLPKALRLSPTEGVTDAVTGNGLAHAWHIIGESMGICSAEVLPEHLDLSQLGQKFRSNGHTQHHMHSQGINDGSSGLDAES